MKEFECDICKKKVTKTNYNGIRIADGSIAHVCGKHYAQYRKFGKFLDASPKGCHDLNDFKVVGDVATIYTRRNNGEISGYFTIDKADLDNVIVRKWRLWQGRFYTGVQKPTTITDFLCSEKLPGQVVDHIDHDPSNNRRSNLRLTTQRNNTINKVLVGTNTSGVAGVWFDKRRDKWSAEIKVNYKKVHLGRYDLFEDACYARYIAEQLLFDEFRNESNDHTLVPMAMACQRKEELNAYVERRIQEKTAA